MKSVRSSLAKVPTKAPAGIADFDEITGGGLPRGRTTLRKDAEKHLAQMEGRRRLVEEALRESEERYRMLLDGIRDYAIFMMDPQGQIVSWNAGA